MSHGSMGQNIQPVLSWKGPSQGNLGILRPPYSLPQLLQRSVPVEAQQHDLFVLIVGLHALTAQ